MVGAISILDGVPPANVFAEWRAREGWGELTTAQAEQTLNATTLSCLAKDGDDLVGFARVLGDGMVYFYIQDVIVRPDRTGLGIGRKMLEHLIEQIRQMAVPPASIMLMAAEGAEAFYEKLGFVARPSDRFGPGMMIMISADT